MANEKRLIAANALRAVFEKWFKNYLKAGEDRAAQDMEDVLLELDAQPTVDAVEVVHGRWVDTDYKPDIYCKCSVCGRRVYAYDDGYNYCPNCGAKMDGGNEDGR